MSRPDPLNFHAITLFPEMFKALDSGVVGRAKDRNLIDIKHWNPRDYTEDNYRKVDDSPFGGGSGMVMLVRPLQKAIEAARTDSNNPKIIYLSPQGRLLDHDLAKELADNNNDLILVSGRYEGIDERLMKVEPGVEVSIGDYVLSGGELASMVLIDAVSRQLPGVVGKTESVENDSFCQGLLEYPHYTRPEVLDDLRVPSVLLSGDHAKISKWRRKESLGRTWLKRPDLLEKIELTEDDRILLNEFIENLS